MNGKLNLIEHKIWEEIVECESELEGKPWSS